MQEELAKNTRQFRNKKFSTGICKNNILSLSLKEVNTWSENVV